MIDLTKRSFVKGLFLSAALPLVSAKSLITNSQAIATAQIYWVEHFTGVRQLTTLGEIGDPNIKHTVIYALDLMDKTALEFNNSYTRLLLFQSMHNKLEPLKLMRELRDYQIIIDERNNFNLEDNPTKKELFCRLTTRYLLHYEFHVVYDPKVLV